MTVELSDEEAKELAEFINVTEEVLHTYKSEVRRGSPIDGPPEPSESKAFDLAEELESRIGDGVE